jgi:hypothetical protein
MREKTMEALFGDINPKESRAYDRDKYTTMSLWIPNGDKARYRALSPSTRQQIINRLREAFLAALDIVEAKAS